LNISCDINNLRKGYTQIALKASTLTSEQDIATMSTALIKSIADDLPASRGREQEKKPTLKTNT
jgi:hypothetical protein